MAVVVVVVEKPTKLHYRALLEILKPFLAQLNIYLKHFTTSFEAQNITVGDDFLDLARFVPFGINRSSFINKAIVDRVS